MARIEHTPTRGITKAIASLLIFTATVMAGAGCSRAPEPDEGLFATYRDGTVTTADYERWLVAVKIYDPPADPLGQIEQLVVTRVLSEAAVSRGVDQQPEVAFQLQLSEDLTLESALGRHMAESISIPEAEIDELVAANPGAFTRPHRVRVYNIFKRFPGGATDEDRAEIRGRMEEIHGELLAGDDFAEIATAESDSETRYRGGRMGTFARGELPPAVDAIVMSLAEGEISEILESNDGLIIFKCDGIFESEEPGLDEVRSKFEANLLRLRRRENHQQFQTKTLRESGLEIDMTRVFDPLTRDDEVVATFGTHVVTRDRLGQMVAARRPSGKRSAPMDEPLVRQTVELYVVTVLAVDQARQLGLDTEELLAGTRLQQQRTLATEELRHRIEGRLEEPTRAEIKEYFEAHRSEFRRPEEVDLMMIGFPFTEKTIQAVHADARTALDVVDSGAMSFAQAIRVYSKTAPVGASPVVTLPPRQLAGFGAAVGKAVRGLTPGQVSRLIREDDRLWIVKLVDRRPVRLIDFDEAESRAQRKLGQERVDALRFDLEIEILSEQQISLAEEVG